jgi:hypothetical protein
MLQKVMKTQAAEKLLFALLKKKVCIAVLAQEIL